MFWWAVSKSRLGPDLGRGSFLPVSLSGVSPMSLSSLGVYVGDSGSELDSGSTVVAAGLAVVGLTVEMLAKMLAEAF